MNDSVIQYGPKGNSKEIENIITHIFNNNDGISNPEFKPTHTRESGPYG